MSLTTNNAAWSCRVSTAWDPLETDRGCISIGPGQDGWIWATTAHGWCFITIVCSGASGWVPERNLQRGSQREDPVRVDIILEPDRAAPSSNTLPGPLAEKNSMLQTTESPEFNSIFWTHMVDRARTVETFCKPPCLLSKAGFSENHVRVNLVGDIFVTFSIDRGPHLAINTIVYLVFELRLDGKPHDAPFSRLPLVGRFTDWRELSRLAVRMEWETPQGCYAIYLQALHPMEPGSEQAPDPYTSASALLAALKGTVFAETSAWRLRIPAPRIIDSSFSHLSQSIHIRERVVRVKRLEPQARENQEINRELKTLGFNVTSTVPEELRHGEGRTTCDTCYVVGSRCHRSEHMLTFAGSKICEAAPSLGSKIGLMWWNVPFLTASRITATIA